MIRNAPSSIWAERARRHGNEAERVAMVLLPQNEGIRHTEPYVPAWECCDLGLLPFKVARPDDGSGDLCSGSQEGVNR